MTREEEIRQASEKHYHRMVWNGEWDSFGHHEYEYEGEDVKKANFIVGAQWADKHPINITPGSKMVIDERNRQIEQEGYDTKHDKNEPDGALSIAAVAYILESKQLFPWDDKFWKPKDKLANLKRAAALIIAEIDKIIEEL